jgi:hypothetical protein
MIQEKTFKDILEDGLCYNYGQNNEIELYFRDRKIEVPPQAYFAGSYMERGGYSTYLKSIRINNLLSLNRGENIYNIVDNQYYNRILQIIREEKLSNLEI